MKQPSTLLLAVCLMLFVFNAAATVRYVDLNCTNATPPFTDWSTAATNIQDAVDAAIAGDTVLVTNGVYGVGAVYSGVASNRVVINKPITVQSINGPKVTAILGYRVPGTTNGTTAVRCVYMASGSELSGFTLTNGSTPNAGLGGGAFCQSISALLTNCIIVGNSATTGGGVYAGTVTDCELVGNIALSIPGLAGKGGGLYVCNAYHCLVVSNSAVQGGGGYSGSYYFCTIAANSATTTGGGVYGGGGAWLYNCIVYYNTAPAGTNLINAKFNNTCTPPPLTAGSGITNEPGFVNLVGGDFHLSPNSPCINAGKNSYVTNTTDLDGNPRIVSGTVDIGAYEFQSPSSTLSYAWAQQYNLPTDGSADTLDADGDGLNNYAEWKAGTIPTNAASVLALASPSNSISGLTVTWQSVANVTYYLQSSTNLPAFTTIASNLFGQTGTFRYTDTTATNGGPYFYRVGVQ